MAGRARSRRRCQTGFTLLEVLVAFAIASLALAVLYEGSVEGLVGTRLAARTNEAVSRARSRIAAVCHGARLMPGEKSGDDGGGFRWTTQINRSVSESISPRAGDETEPAMRADLFAVRVTIAWPGHARPHAVSLETRCLSVEPENHSP